MKQPKHSKYTTAENMFIVHGYTCTFIAEQLQLTETTLSKWRTAMKWDDQRKQELAAPGKIRSILLDEIESISSGNKPNIDTDALSKVAKTLSYFDGKIALSIIISVFKEFDNWMTENDPELAVRFIEYHRRFANYRASIDSLK